MIITFCTDTYVEWGKVFLKSFKYTNGVKTDIHINGLYLSNENIKALKNCYPRVTISNYQYPSKDVCKRFGVTPKDFSECKSAISLGFKKNCRWWMDFVVVEERITKLLEHMKKHPHREYWLHLDIDMMFRKSIEPLLDIIRNNYVTARFRPDRTFIKNENEISPEYMRLAGGMVGLRGSFGIDFVEEWVKQIFTKMGNGIQGRGEPWGQTALYYAYERFKDYYKWGEIPKEWLTAYCHHERPIWCGHKKGNVTVHHENGEKERVGIQNRTLFRERVFLPELARLKEKSCQH